MAVETTGSTDLTALDDPALIRAWALARTRAAVNRGDHRARAAYAALQAEYRRRIRGQARPEATDE